MVELVADTSGLVSLGTGESTGLELLETTLTEYDVVIPSLVRSELEDVASFDDVHARGARAVLEQLGAVTVIEDDIDDSFPLDSGENAAVTVANHRHSELLLCDEFRDLPLIHASLTETRLITTPTLLRILNRRGLFSSAETRRLLDRLSEARSWEGNSYVQRVRDTL